MSADLSRLYQTYRNAKTTFGKEAAENFFAPLLVMPPENWFCSEHRIAIVGQETLGWMWTKDNADHYGYDWDRADTATLSDFFDSEHSVGDLMHGYRLFDFSSRQPINSRSPFWRYFRKVAQYFEGETCSMLFTNVIRCAADHEAGLTLWTVDPETRTAYLKWQSGLLRRELILLDPTLVIFVSGPHYDGYLAKEFSGIIFEQCSELPARIIASVKSDDLPMAAYRTYHPGYLNRRHKFEPVESALRHYERRDKSGV